MIKIAVFIVVLLANLLQAAEPVADSVTVFETKTGNRITLSEAVLQLNQADVVFVGENHDDLVTHQLELEIFRQLTGLSKSWNLSLEMFERDVQDTLEKYLKGEISEEVFLSDSRPWPNYMTDYRPLVESAKESGLHVLAANIPRQYASMVAKQGPEVLKKLSTEEAALVSHQLLAPEDRYYEKFLETMKAQMGEKGARGMGQMFKSMYNAQCIKDDTMAESIFQYLSANPGKKIVQFNGDFHSDERLGTPQRLSLLNGSLEITVVSIVPVDDPKIAKLDPKTRMLGDFVIFCERKSEGDKLSTARMFKNQNQVRIKSHYIDAALYPVENRIEAQDRVVLESPTRSPFFFYLYKGLTVGTIETDSLPYGSVEIQNDLRMTMELKDDYIVVAVTPAADKPLENFLVRYSGKIYEPLQGRKLNQTHDFTPGMISCAINEGVFLPASCGWYPYVENELSRFTARISVPTTLTVVTQGDTVKREITESREISSWDSDKPFDGLTLVAGNFRCQTLQAGKVALSTYLAPDHAQIADEILPMLKSYLEFYEKTIGTFPYQKYDVVENFFPSGFGMPTFTVLAPQLLNPKMLFVLRDPGVLAHELVHSWWGNCVFPDPESGNWCEALTTYFANYYWIECNDGEKGARDWRRRTVMEYSEIKPGEDYPLNDFKTQNDRNDALIGYNKGAMFLHHLRRICGDDKFMNSVRHFTESCSGRYAGWQQLRNSFLKNYEGSRDLNQVFEEWLLRKGAPDFKFEKLNKTDKAIEFDLCFTGEVYHINIPVVFNSPKPNERIIEMEQKSKHVYFESSTAIISASIDPDFHVLRKVYPEEYPLSLSMTLERKPLIIIPDEGQEHERFLEFAKALGGENCLVRKASEFKQSDLEQDLFLLGNLENNPGLNLISSKLTGIFSYNKFGFTLNSVLYGKNLQSGLVTIRNPFQAEKLISFYYCNSLDAVKPVRNLAMYSDCSYYVFDLESQSGKPLVSGEILSGKSPLEIE
ncbi:MAG: ChaN family lipoprotein [Candidatus Wallbacteria bacterium]|nr:ChaN family lipoprotein [Candidatus Wallbacteria bacterium]